MLVYISWLLLWWLRSTYITCLKGNKFAPISYECYWRYIFTCFKDKKALVKIAMRTRVVFFYASPPQHFHENPASYIIPKTSKVFEILRLNLKCPENEFSYLLQTVSSVVENWRVQIFFFACPSPYLCIYLFVCLFLICKN